MARLGNINQYEQKKAQRKADALPAAVPPVQEAIRPQSQELREGFQQMGQMNPQKPVLQTRDANEMYQATRSQALGHESNLADPQKAQEFWNASPYEYWTEQVKRDPNNAYAVMNQMFASNETPEQKQKRERREQLGEVFNNLGNLIGNAANLYYTTKGGQYIDLNSVNEKHRARMERLREKQEALKQRQDELLGKAKLSDIQAERAERAAKVKDDADARAKELDYKRDLALKQIEHAFRIGQIDAQTAANMKRDAAKATSAKELEAFKQSNRITLKTTPSYGEDKVVDSAIGADGNIYTRNSRLTDNEAMQIVLSSVPDDEFSQFVTTDENGRERTDWRAAAAYALQKGYVSEDELKQMGFKRGKTSKKKDGSSLGIGIGNNNNNGNKLGIGL